ncbi:unnamed protein product [Trichogramma brassicae]|uniref:Large ribosomal subunit protein P2 n=1 Tax=Trichogramma brassicae TaxID=86971 RepID=A0A6H5J9G1_9HYME|nr:unnamed protein product [Trichogramma brassicae]
MEFLNGKLPKVIHFNVVRIGKDRLPTNEEDLKTWLEERWRLKEQQLDKFEKYKKFDSEIWPEAKEPRTPLVAALIFWTLCSKTLGVIRHEVRRVRRSDQTHRFGPTDFQSQDVGRLEYLLGGDPSALYASVLRQQSQDRRERSKSLVSRRSSRCPKGALGQIRGAIYLKRNWQLDKDTFVEYLDYHREIGKKVQILFFPEGTDFTEKNRRNSDRYASERGLPLYRHVIHPRTTGFANVTLYWQQIDCLDAIYDLTFAYPDLEPNPFKKFLCGHLPYEIHVYVRRFDKDDLPRDEIGLKHWLQQRWKIKEESLTRFHEDKRFDCPRRSDADGTPLTLAFLLWSFSCCRLFLYFYMMPLRCMCSENSRQRAARGSTLARASRKSQWSSTAAATSNIGGKFKIGEKIQTILKAASVDVEPYWPGLFAKAVEGLNVKDLITNIGSGVGAAPAGGAAPAAAAATDAPAAKEEKKKEEPEEESDDDMGFGKIFKTITFIWFITSFDKHKMIIQAC